MKDLMSIEQLKEGMRKDSYICDDQLAFVIYLALAMEKPLLLEGEPGVGKTEVAKVLSHVLNSKLIRLQCYEGLDATATIYEWNYAKQLLKIKTLDVCEPSYRLDDIFTDEYLIARPLLAAIKSKEKTVLLIDEIDRADEEFEAFLLEVLSDFQISIPEMGTIQAIHKPLVIITSNQVRELQDGLKRRCLYHYIDYPAPEREQDIISAKVPTINSRLAGKIAAIMAELRSQDFYKRPGVAETLDWSQALMILEKEDIDEEVMERTCGCLFKFKEDVRRFQETKGDVLKKIGAFC